MLYRRYGKTDLQIPVFSCGGMRYQQSWKDGDPISDDNQKNLEATILKSLEVGINHIETARGYGTSEVQLGKILPRLPREKMIIQTKVAPHADPKEFHKTFNTCMEKLQLEYVDLLSIHGINNQECLDQSIRKGGCLDAALEIKKSGRARHIGFSTHAYLPTITEAINDGRFEYINLHWYYIYPHNWPAIVAARSRDMGVFIISPNDKGGLLYKPSEKLKALCDPLSPMVFNGLWCLVRPQVHTLSCGAARPSDFDEHLKTVDLLKLAPEKLTAILKPIEQRLEAELEKTVGREWLDTWHVGLPDFSQVPGQVNVFEILRLRNYVKAFDMVEFGKMRYGLLGNGGHWFPGHKLDKLSGTKEELRNALRFSPHIETIPDALEEAHGLMSGEERKRQGSQ